MASSSGSSPKQARLEDADSDNGWLSCESIEDIPTVEDMASSSRPSREQARLEEDADSDIGWLSSESIEDIQTTEDNTWGKL